MCVLYIMDINDIGGSFAEDIFQRIEEKELDCTIVLNKIDTMPKNSKLADIKKSIKDRLKTLHPSISKVYLNRTRMKSSLFLRRLEII